MDAYKMPKADKEPSGSFYTYWNRAIKQGHPIAFVSTIYRPWEGRTSMPSLFVTEDAYTRAIQEEAQKDDERAKTALGILQLVGYKVRKNPEFAWQNLRAGELWARLIAFEINDGAHMAIGNELGNLPIIRWQTVSDVFALQIPGDSDEDQAALLNRAQSGDAEAMLEYGKALYPYVPNSDTQACLEAANWVLKAAEQGNKEAARIAAVYSFFKKPGFGSQTSEFMTTLTKAAELGDIEMQTVLGGQLILKGWQESKREAFDLGKKWLQRSAENGSAEATTFLGRLSLYGIGETVDREAGVELLKRAAALGECRAIEDLALLSLREGNRDGFLTGMQEAANNGSPRARFYLLIADDLVVPDDADRPATAPSP